jgi:hypothetical protein
MQEGKSAIATQSHQTTTEEKKEKHLCFVIMPLGHTSKEHSKKYWEFFYKHVLKKAMEESAVNYDCEEPKAGRANIMKDVVNKLVNAHLVLGILTDKNPNVWYELGVRHGLQKPTVMVMEEGEKIPFDISQYGVVTYDNKIINKSRLLPLIHYLALVIRFILRKGDKPSSKNGKEEIKIENEETNDTPVYFDLHNREYLGQKGFREKLSVEEYEKFREKLQFFTEDTRKAVDNPIMEFMNLPTIQLLARTNDIKINEKLEIRAEVTMRDCSGKPDIEAYFAVSDSEIAKLNQNYSQKTDCNGVIYGEIEGRGQGETYVMVMARLSEEQMAYGNTKIKVNK